MISSLEDAWNWYASVKEATEAMTALGKRHWDNLPWDGPLGQDDRLRLIEATKVQAWGGMILSDLDDLCVLLLFSVFEARVRERALADVAAEAATLRHPALQHAARTLNDSLAHGSFFKVTEAYKALDPNLTEQVNQVRKYRNWVAHGRSGDPESAVDPRMAYARLEQFLARLGK